MTSPLRRLRHGVPGSVDLLNARELFDSANQWGFPDLAPFDPERIPSRWHAWPNRKHASADDGIHCFTDDYRFEPMWRSPDRYEIRNTLIGPDFSIYPEYPLALQVWQVYRARWMVAALRARDVACIPAVSWAHPSTFALAFAGLPLKSTIAISAYGATRNRHSFMAGYEAMYAQLSPRQIIIIGGKLPEKLPGPYVYFPSIHIERVRAWADEDQQAVRRR